jgi:kumamolisin
MTFFTKLRVTLMCGAILAPVLAQAVSAEGRFRLSNSNLPFAENVRVLRSADSDQTVEFQIALKMRNYAELQDRIAKGEVIPADQMAANYYPAASDHADLAQWLENQGLTVKAYNNRLLIEVSGSVATVSRALGVAFSQVLVNGKVYTASQSAPALPSRFGRFVVGVNGLQSYLEAVPLHSRVTPQSPTQAFVSPYSVNDILTAYGAKNLGVDGTNQKTAILIDTVPRNSDLQSFWSANNIPQSLSRIETVNVTGGTLPAPVGEETLDVAWSSAIAPNSSVRIYATSSFAFTNLDRGLQRIISDIPSQPNLKQLSISLGSCERQLPTSQIQTDEQLLAAIAGQGVSTFAASGDTGSKGGDSGLNTVRAKICKFANSVSYFASSAAVTAVGGTTLRLNSSGAVTSETGWSGSGGGISGKIGRPSWQSGAGVPSGTTRLVPDISANADPNTGYYLVLNGQVTQIGGTSASAPVWAGFSALINQSRATIGKRSLGLLGPRVYPLIGTSSFRDITSGSNGAYQATANFDLVTGIGVPVVSNLLPTLVAQP